MNLSVIIPSKTASNLVPCVEAVRKHEPHARIVVVDDGLDIDALSQSGDGDCWSCDNDPLRIVPGVKPFIFARNANLGIRAAAMWHDSDAVVLLNDDATLETPRGFTAMQHLAEWYPEYGVIGAVTNITGQPLQQPRNIGLREVPHIAFVCVLIPKRTIDKIGLLDERYSLDYGCEDLDYCEACTRAGLKIGVFDGCFVDHSKLRSTFRGNPQASLRFDKNKALFDAKWSVTA